MSTLTLSFNFQNYDFRIHPNFHINPETDLKKLLEEIIQDLKDAFLLYALKNEVSEDMLVYLKTIKANINRTFNYYSLLASCISGENFISTKWLIKNGTKIDNGTTHGWSNILLASQFDNLELIKLLVERGANVKDITEDCGMTTLMLACEENYSLDIIKFFVENAVDINANSFPSENSYTALMMASESCGKEVVKYLIDKGADVKYLMEYLDSI